MVIQSCITQHREGTERVPFCGLHGLQNTIIYAAILHIPLVIAPYFHKNRINYHNCILINVAMILYWVIVTFVLAHKVYFIASLAKEVMFLVALVSLSVCLFVCGQHYSKSYERIGMKFYGRVLSSTRKNWLHFGGDLGIVRWVNEQNKHRNSGSIPRSWCR